MPTRPHPPLAVTAADVDRAADVLRGVLEPTPTSHSIVLSEITGADVWVKFENFQFTASFKERGAAVKLASLTPQERARGVVTMSAGNHAQAVAFHARRLGIPATIVMPRHTPRVKVQRTTALGARVELHGDDLDGAAARAAELVEHEGLVFIPPFDDPAVIAGAGTVALELLDAAPDLDVIVVPIGGGGLAAGVAVAATHRKPGIEVVGVQTEAFPAVLAALGRTDRPSGGPTMAEGIAVARPGTLTVPIIAALCSDVVTVSEDRIEEAVSLYLEIEKVVAEGAAAAGLAALLEYPDRFTGRRVGLIVTGGNIDLRLLADVLVRELVRTGRLVHLRVAIADVPGALGRVCTVVGDGGGNIVDVSHHRLYRDVSVKRAVLDLTVETRDRAHVDALVERLGEHGFPTTVLSDLAALPPDPPGPGATSSPGRTHGAGAD